MCNLDVEQHEESRNRYLFAMLEMTQEMEKTDSRPARLLNISETAIAKKARLDIRLASRIVDELRDEGIIESDRVLAGQSYHFTAPGRRMAEQYLYEKSSLAKRRKLVGAIKEHSAAGAASLLKEAGKWLGGIIIGAAGTTYGPAILKMIRELLGIK